MKKLILTAAFLASAGHVTAQWSTDSTQNNVVCTQSGQQNMASTAQYQDCLCTDDSGGVIALWEDSRDISAIYAQRINNGNLMWNSAGVPVATRAAGSASLINPFIISDGNGGAIMAWQRSASGSGDSIYAQRVNASGIVQWAVNGVPVCTNGNKNELPVMCTDGHAGAIIAWINHIPNEPSIFVQHLDSTGETQWAADGISVRLSSSSTIYPQICSDGAGGAFIAWADPNTYKELIQRILPDGSLQWASPGLQVSANSPGTLSIPRICSDGQNGAIVVWHQAIVPNSPKVYAQRVDGSGNLRWTSGGVIVCSQYSICSNITSDGNGGVIAAWNDYRASKWNVYAQRINSAGSAAWTADGVPVANTGKTPGTVSYYPSICMDGSGGAIFAFLDERDGGTIYHLYAQDVDSAGTALWLTNGMTVTNNNTGGGQSSQQMIASESGKAIVVWEDSRGSGASNLYASAVGGGALLPVELVSFSVRAQDGNELLAWTTATETKSYGFDIERENLPDPPSSATWSKIGFVVGSGTSAAQHQYSFNDPSLPSGRYAYRLKEIDRDGAFTYSRALNVEVLPHAFSISQNYPNPFNPSTRITFEMPTDGRVNLSVYDMLGRAVAVLFDGNVKAGSVQNVTFDGSKLSSGVYIARIQCSGVEALRKMILMK